MELPSIFSRPQVSTPEMPCYDTMMILGFCTTSSYKWPPWTYHIATTQVLQFFHPFFSWRCNNFIFVRRPGRAIVAKNSTWNLLQGWGKNALNEWTVKQHVEELGGWKGSQFPHFCFEVAIYIYIICVLKRSCSRHIWWNVLFTSTRVAELQFKLHNKGAWGFQTSTVFQLPTSSQFMLSAEPTNDTEGIHVYSHDLVAVMGNIRHQDASPSRALGVRSTSTVC